MLIVFVFSSRGNSLSPEFPRVDGASLPPAVKIKRLDNELFCEASFLDCGTTQQQGQSTQVPRETQEPDAMLLNRSNASFIYKTRAPRRGTCLIISVDSFKPALCLPGRPGADVDLQKLETTFRMIDFDVKAYENPTAAEILTIVKTGALFNLLNIVLELLPA